jgi:hypothetical protein
MLHISHLLSETKKLFAKALNINASKDTREHTEIAKFGKQKCVHSFFYLLSRQKNKQQQKAPLSGFFF